MWTPSRLPECVQALAAERVRQGCAAYGLTEGPIHAELRIHEGEAWIIEIAGRTIGETARGCSRSGQVRVSSTWCSNGLSADRSDHRCATAPPPREC